MFGDAEIIADGAGQRTRATARSCRLARRRPLDHRDAKRRSSRVVTNPIASSMQRPGGAPADPAEWTPVARLSTGRRCSKTWPSALPAVAAVSCSSLRKAPANSPTSSSSACLDDYLAHDAGSPADMARRAGLFRPERSRDFRHGTVTYWLPGLEERDVARRHHRPRARICTRSATPIRSGLVTTNGTSMYRRCALPHALVRRARRGNSGTSANRWSPSKSCRRSATCTRCRSRR